MSIDEAIKHCQEVSNSCDNLACSFEHTQLENWLIELKYYRERYGEIEKNPISLLFLLNQISTKKRYVLMKFHVLKKLMAYITVIITILAFGLITVIFITI